MPLTRHHGLFPTPRGIGTLRRYDAYKAARKSGVAIQFESFEPFGMPGMHGLCMPDNNLVVIDSELDEIGRHDELAHQLSHLRYHKSGRAGVDEDRICQETARRLIPVQPLIAAIEMVLDEEEADDPTANTAVAVADLLGAHVATLRDRLRGCSLRELAGEFGALYSRLTWPKVQERVCIHESSLHQLLQPE